ncbi:TetR family transcriptional regulator [Modestobacter sp. NPDC049651]|uniref:TetR/AcrR family transcriptional regulator n=1 Tax=unclassified Modestobacter TaxID=2643866 RepID=UPI0033E860AF
MAAPRPRSAAGTRAAILTAARTRFAADGYERTTLRAVAGDVGVDAALVVRYFGTKEALFSAAAEFELRLPDLAGVAPGDVAAALLPRFFAVWEEQGTFLALLRAAATSEAAAAAMREVFVRQVAPALAAVTPDQPARRAALVGSQVLGLAFTRYVLRAAPLAEMSRDELAAAVAPVLAHYLSGPLG